MAVLAMERTMAVAERASRSEAVQPRNAEASDPRSLVARLAALHAEAKETARLANLLGRSIHVAAALVAMGGATLLFAGILTAENLVWSGFMLVAVGVIAIAFRRTIKRPFERAALKSFSQDFDAIMAFGGTAWGAGAFLALPADTSFAAPILFSAGAGAIIAVLLREYETTLHFLAPVAALASYACVLRPLPGSALAAALVLIACALVAALSVMAARWNDGAQSVAELAQLPFG
jgi:hypothetical protein